MLEYLGIVISAFLASLLSFFSGFGLGTILMPIVAIFFPLPIAIGFTAVVHLLHNLLKTGLLWRSIHWAIAMKFGLVAFIAAIPGAFLLKQLSEITPLKEYSLLGIQGAFSILHICIGLLLIFFATLEIFPYKVYKIKNVFLGGALSGFFGGLSGNQGALRSVFLIHTNLDKKAFVGTSALIATLVDIVRLVVYSLSFRHLFMSSNKALLSAAIAAAMAGIFSGMTILRKVTMEFIRKVIVILLYLFGVLLVLGMI